MLPQRQDRPFAVVLLGLVLACAAGCGGSSSGPKTLPPITPTATATSSTPTATPGDSKKAELAAATAVVRRYFHLLGAATTPATVRALSTLVTRGCKCEQIVRSFRDAIRQHEHYVGAGRITLVRPSLDSARVAEVLFRFDSSAGGLVRSDGSYVQHQAAQRGVVENARLIRSGGGWRIDDVALISKGRS